MSTSQISRRYARALFDLISEGTNVREDLAAVAAVASEAEVAALLVSPEYPVSLKQQVIIKASGGKISAEIERLVALLAERNKVALLPEIADMVDEMIHQAESELEADVTVASSMDEALQDKLSKALTASTGKKVRLSISEDKSILGGMVVRIGDRKIDYSLRTKLAGLRRALAS
ncbi:F-type H+-transporting ATPase subunit delta [Mariprofundus micogutta]|uniref:ATP synthase subunit delta n=1 Tax=Mariprofundus micogutta TaxID=1921010 RepID=A0A1L8CPK2_9PROT|nr:F0F1 ATP synthase subunit delta [Mariprofundus micogutta]GAV20852.1 F-type H+-transporting ATPase subunit delta [Mariprofundus micogutta]